MDLLEQPAERRPTAAGLTLDCLPQDAEAQRKPANAKEDRNAGNQETQEPQKAQESQET
jgi:hypothetical protein